MTVLSEPVLPELGFAGAAVTAGARVGVGGATVGAVVAVAVAVGVGAGVGVGLGVGVAGAIGMTGLDLADGALVPAAFEAVTVKV